MIFYEVVVLVRYSIDFEGKMMIVYNIFLIGQQSVESVAFFLICYFFTKKASGFLKENKRIRHVMKKTMIVAMILVVLATLF